MKLDEYLRSCRELSALCSQNGWIDNDTLDYEVTERSGDTLTASVSFDEVLMEGSGCPAGRVSCWGKLRVELDPEGHVRSTEIVAG